MAACSSSGGKPSTNTSGSSSSNSQSSSSSSGSGSTSAPSADDLTFTLINPADIPGDTFTLKSSDPVSDAAPAVGVDGEFANADGSRKVTDALIWFPSASGAATALAAELTAGKQQIVSGLTDNALSVGTGGRIYQGNDASGPATIILFQEGNYVVTLEFNATAAGDAIPANLATGVATAQDSKIKAAS